MTSVGPVSATFLPFEGTCRSPSSVGALSLAFVLEEHISHSVSRLACRQCQGRGRRTLAVCWFPTCPPTLRPRLCEASLDDGLTLSVFRAPPPTCESPSLGSCCPCVFPALEAACSGCRSWLLPLAAPQPFHQLVVAVGGLYTLWVWSPGQRPGGGRRGCVPVCVRVCCPTTASGAYGAFFSVSISTLPDS